MAQSTWAEEAAALEEQSTNFWKPESGDSLAGTLRSVETGVGKTGTSTVYTVETEDGSVVSFWGSAVLDRELRKAGEGDLVLVKFFGTKTGATGTVFKSYGVKIRKQSGDKIPF